MSVKITHHSEKRNTSIGNFLLAITLPLLLVGALGYVIGSSRSGDAEKNAMALASLRTEYGQLRDEHEALNTYLLHIDSLRNDFDDEIRALDKEKQTAFTVEVTSFSMTPIADWWEDVREKSVSYKRELADLVGTTEGNHILNRQQIAIPSELFEDYNTKSIEIFDAERQCRIKTGISGSDCARELDDMANVHKEELADLRRELNQTKSRIDDLSRDKERLQDRIANTGQVICPDNTDLKSEIKDGASEINAAIQELNLGRGFLGLKKKDQEKVEKIQIEIERLTQRVRDSASEVD